MVRTQISLSEEEYRLAKEEAKKLGISLAEYFRRALRGALPIPAHKPWMAFRGTFDSGNPRASETVDDVVYGEVKVESKSVL